MTTIGYINVSLETFGGILSLIFILCLKAVPDLGIKLEQSYIRMLQCNTILLFSDAAAWLFKGRADHISFYAVRIANFFVFVLGYVILVLFTQYLVNFLALKNVKIQKSYLTVISIIMFLGIILVCVSQINHMYYRIDASNIYRRQAMFWLSQSFGMAGMIINGLLLIRYKSHMERREKMMFTVYIFLPVAALIFQIVFYNVAVLYLATTICLICMYVSIQIDLLDKISQKQLMIEKKHVAVMVSQIKPHFLYNALTAIKSLCDVDSGKASEALEHFAYYLRGNLDSFSDSGLIPFTKELEHVEDYLYLEKMRLGDKLDVCMEIAVSEFALPPLSLQPIIENAVKHGIAKRKEGGKLTIRTERLTGKVVITIADDGMGFDINLPAENNRSHIGMENVKKRIELQCNGEIAVKSNIGLGTTVYITLPQIEI